MIQIKAKIYFLVATGEIIKITEERQGSESCVIKTTKEEDMQVYLELQHISINDIDFIELEYGTLGSTFNNVKSYSVNVETKQLELLYYTQEELNAIQQQNQEIQDLNSRVSDISTYLSDSDETTIADIENSILEIEKNKTVNGGM